MASFSGDDFVMSKTLARVMADPTCVCKQAMATVQYINHTADPYAGAVIPGLSHRDTALLAGILTGLAAFLFLALPILCCLCPLPCACCGGGAGGKGGKGGKSGGGRGGTESVRSSFSELSISKYGGGGKASLWENVGGLIMPDMKIPRARADSLSKSMEGDYDSRWRQGGEADWEGLDVQRLEQQLEYHGRGNGSGLNTFGGGETMQHSSSRMMHENSGLANDGVIEYETTRQITIESIGVPDVTTQRTFEAMASGLPQQEYIYETAMRQQHIDGGVERIRLG